jgi:adenylate cyclase
MNFLRKQRDDDDAGVAESSSSLDEQVSCLVQKFGQQAVEASIQRVIKSDSHEQQRETAATATTTNFDNTSLQQERELNFNNISRQQERELNRTLLDASFEAVVLCNARGKIIKVNKAALRILRYKNEAELLDQSVSIMVGGGEAKYHDEYFEKYRRRGMNSPHFGVLREVQAKTKDGTEIPCIIGIKKLSGENSTLTVAFLRDITKEKEALELAVQKRAAEELLLNVLPEEVAHRLKEDPKHIADNFQTATILFADIVGFTEMSSGMEAADVVSMLNDLFSRFDARLETYRLNKIKTIGDCYMICSVPNGGKDPELMCKAVCHFALDMIDLLDQYNEDHADEMEKPLSVRIGMDCGPIVAGVIGTKRFLYDVWGHPVNVASRMESTGQPRRIQVTKKIVESVPDDEFTFTSRGAIQVKGIGEMATFFLDDRLKTRSSTYWSLLSTPPRQSTRKGSFKMSKTKSLNVV